MTAKSNSWITAIVALILFAAIFYFGYVMYPKWNDVPVPVTDTIIIHDTVIHTIPDTFPWYITKIDTIILRDTIPIIPDTAAILANHYAFHTYNRSWKDSLLSVDLTDVISENRVYDSYFRYKILREQTIITNVTNNYSYNRYLYLGGSIAIPDSKMSSVGVFFASERLLLGGGYMPYLKNASLTAGFKIAKFKK